MTIDLEFLDGTFRQGNWGLILPILLAIGLSIGFPLLLLWLLSDMHLTAIQSRFRTDAPETIFEQAYVDYTFVANLMLRGIIRSLLLIMGFFGTAFLCSITVNFFSAREIFFIQGSRSEIDNNAGLGFTGGILFMISLWISIYTRAINHDGPKAGHQVLFWFYIMIATISFLVSLIALVLTAQGIINDAIQWILLPIGIGLFFIFVAFQAKKGAKLFYTNFSFNID